MNLNGRFLLGHGERLTAPLASPSRRPEKTHPYSFKEAIARLTPQINKVANAVKDLQPIFCPNDESVFCIDLHPSYLAKSYFPTRILDKLELRAVGSRMKNLIPDKTTKKKNGLESSLELFVAGKRESIYRWHENFNDQDFENDIIKIESIRIFEPKERIKGNISDNQDFEIVLHASQLSDDYIIIGFEKLLKSLGIKPLINRRIQTQDLCFIPVTCPVSQLDNIEKFSFLRVLRPVPKMRGLAPTLRQVGIACKFNQKFPDADPVDPNIKVAVFDGGCKIPEAFERWVKGYVLKGSTPSDEGISHGSTVNSALLFGSLSQSASIEIPYAEVHNYQVLSNKDNDPFELYNVLNNIKTVLSTRQYGFINLSIGPALPIDDDEVHAWTAVLDEYLSKGETLATIAVGNNGESDVDSGNARIQVPSDCVNGLAIGASTDYGNNKGWERASYSARGPGRSPGRIKPDILSFGGDIAKPFLVVSPENNHELIPVCGTSYAAPNALRMAVGLKAHFKDALSVLSIRTLLIHRSCANDGDVNEAGWGCLPKTLEEMVLCKDGVVTIVYQGELEPAQYIKAEIPYPDEDLKGDVILSATFCFASSIDSKDPANYTRSGLEVTLRPDVDDIIGKDSSRPKSRAFFKSKPYETEKELRSNTHKWETVLSGKEKIRANKLQSPFFEIHYSARDGGANAKHAKPIPYALVVTLEMTKEPELYNKISTRYRTVLEPILPVEIPIQIG